MGCTTSIWMANRWITLWKLPIDEFVRYDFTDGSYLEGPEGKGS